MQVERSVINNSVRNLTDNKDDINEYEPPLKKGPGVGTSSGSQGPQQHVVPSSPPVSTTNLLPAVSSDYNNNDNSNSCSNSNNPKCNVAASVIANKYLILDQLEASALHMCIDINSHQQYVCKVSLFHFIFYFKTFFFPCWSIVGYFIRHTLYPPVLYPFICAYV